MFSGTLTISSITCVDTLTVPMATLDETPTGKTRALACMLDPVPTVTVSAGLVMLVLASANTVVVPILLEESTPEGTTLAFAATIVVPIEPVAVTESLSVTLLAVTTDKPMLPVAVTPVKPVLASPTTIKLPAVLVAETLCITKRVSAVVEKGLVENGEMPKIIYEAV